MRHKHAATEIGLRQNEGQAHGMVEMETAKECQPSMRLGWEKQIKESEQGGTMAASVDYSKISHRESVKRLKHKVISIILMTLVQD